MSAARGSSWQTLDTPFGAPLELRAGPRGLEAAFFLLDRRTRRADRPNALTRKATRQLREYCAGRRRDFSLPLAPMAPDGPASDYCRTVWTELGKIPYGQTRTYAEIAAQAGGSARSAGTANGRNRLCIIIPCHRVVRKDGLGGYGGPLAPSRSARMLEIKRRLLEHERRHA